MLRISGLIPRVINRKNQLVNSGLRAAFTLTFKLAVIGYGFGIGALTLLDPSFKVTDPWEIKK
ncbi:MAG: hypothetical protein HQ564_02860 [Candidatus Saganbacteria bacterium]|nr:hypothetical protein [Candidatus Saganbacteria bacterium]